MTLSQHITQHGKRPESVQKQWRRKQLSGEIARPFSRDLEPTPEELAIVFGSSRTEGQTDNTPAPVSTPEKTSTRTVRQTNKAADDKTDAPKRTKGQRAALLSVMAVCALVSLSNMYDISCQIKTHFVDAALITGLFSLAPFAMLYAGVSGLAGWLVSGVCIAFEVFCNTSGMYRGLAGLGKGTPYEVWQAGGFIDTVSRVTTLEARPCALVISGGMAAIVAALFITCLIELKK